MSCTTACTARVQHLNVRRDDTSQLATPLGVLCRCARCCTARTQRVRKVGKTSRFTTRHRRLLWCRWRRTAHSEHVDLGSDHISLSSHARFVLRSAQSNTTRLSTIAIYSALRMNVLASAIVSVFTTLHSAHPAQNKSWL